VAESETVRGVGIAARGRGRLKAAGALVAAMIAVIACGKDRPPPTGGTYAATSGGASGVVPFVPTGPKPLPGCGEQDNGGYCDCVDTPLFADPPNIYFVLDRSGSMAVDGKWDQVRVVAAQIFRGLGPRANFGVTVFPGFEQASCAPAKEVLPISPGDPPGSDGPTTAALLQTTSGVPYGGTPTAQALRAVAQTLHGVTGKTFIILATDGGPNCNTAAACSFDQCMPNIENQPGCPAGGPANCCMPPDGFLENCLDGAATNSAVLALKQAGIPVYVVGLPGTAAYGTLLDQLAVSGGTPQATSPKYYKVGSATENALLAALKQIAAKIVATCEFKLKEAPKAANLVNVYFDEIVLPKDPVNGWKIEGETVTLVGTACSKVLAGDVLDVRIIAGCPTVEPR
jgi:hypothetical protein